MKDFKRDTLKVIQFSNSCHTKPFVLSLGNLHFSFHRQKTHDQKLFGYYWVQHVTFLMPATCGCPFMASKGFWLMAMANIITQEYRTQRIETRKVNWTDHQIFRHQWNFFLAAFQQILWHVMFRRRWARVLPRREGNGRGAN